MSIPTQIAETIQTAHINRAPSPHHDLNPSTSASVKEPVRVSSSSSVPQKHHPGPDDDEEELILQTGGEDEEDDNDGVSLVDHDDDDDNESDIPISVLRPHRRRQDFPPMPDLRFEQSYLHSIENAQSWGKVAWITARDQIMMPFAQGVLYNLAICGWQFWNRTAQYSGGSVGARIRRWWYEVNNWKIPQQTRRV